MASNPLRGMKSTWNKITSSKGPKDEVPRVRSLSAIGSIGFPPNITRSVDELLERIAREQRELDSAPLEEHIEAMCIQRGNVFDDPTPRLRLRKLSNEHMKSVHVLGMELSHLSEIQQYLLITSFMFTVQIVYGFAQEYIVVSLFKRTLPLFICLCQMCGYALLIGMQRLLEGSLPRVVPKRYGVVLAVMQVTNQCLSNIAMQHVNYTVKVLFKSSRIVPTMIFGVFYNKRRHHITDYIAVVFIVAGLIIFLEADAKGHPTDSSSWYDMFGNTLLCICVFVDAAMLNIQEELMHHYLCQPSEIVHFMYTGGSFLMLVLNVWSGELWKGLEFVLHQDNGFIRAYLPMATFAVTGYLTTTCSPEMIKHFGAITTSITATIRRGLTVVFSFILFPKPIYPQHYIGWCVFTVGALTKALRKRSPKSHQ